MPIQFPAQGGSGKRSTGSNNAPVNTVPGAQIADTAVFKLISGVSVTDPDGDPLTVSVSCLHGTVGLSTGGGGIITGNGTALVTVSGTIAQCNSALSGLNYISVVSYVGSETITILTSDGSLSDSDNISVTVSAPAGAGTTSNLAYLGPYTPANGGRWLDATTYGVVADNNPASASANVAAIRAILVAMQSASDSFHAAAFPAGTIYIDQQIDIPVNGAAGSGIIGKMFVGADPSTTIFKWSGAAGGDMFRTLSCHTFAFKRMTLDGNGTARMGVRFEYDAAMSLAPTNMRVEDVWFLGLQWGWRASKIVAQGNSLNSEVSFLRCRFYGGYGVETNSGEAFDHWIMHCRFFDCIIGARTTTGGDFKAMYNNFYRSTVVDMEALGFRGASIRNNESTDSKKFLTAAGCNLLTRDNKIITPVDTNCVLYDHMLSGMALDNQFQLRPGATGPVIVETAITDQYEPQTPYESLALAPMEILRNKFSKAGPNISIIQTNSIINGNLDSQTIDTTPRVLPDQPPQVTPVRFIVERAPNFQTRVDQAVAYKTANPSAYVVVYLPDLGYYDPSDLVDNYRTRQTVPGTVVFPPNIEIHLEGDSPTWSILQWPDGAPEKTNTATNVPYYQFQGPSKVRITDIAGGWKGSHAWGKWGPSYAFTDSDSSSGRVWIDHWSGDQVRALGLSDTLIDATHCGSYQHHVTGPATTPGPSRLYYGHGSLGDAGPGARTATNGGRLIGESLWNEAQDFNTIGYKGIGNSGVQRGLLAIVASWVEQHTNPNPPYVNQIPVVGSESFNGDVIIVEGAIIGQFLASGDCSLTDFYDFMGHLPRHATSIAVRDYFGHVGIGADISPVFQEFSIPTNRPAQGIFPASPNMTNFYLKLDSTKADLEVLWANRASGQVEAQIHRCSGSIDFWKGAWT